MEQLTKLIEGLNGIVWGPPMLVLILGTGLYLSIGLRGLSIGRIGYGFRMLWTGRRGQGAGDITPFNALMTSLAATIGIGNIAGVATAIAVGGPGALFWMWMTALVGMATKYAEAVLAMRYRELDERGNHVGGPMYYIKNGMGKKWLWMAAAFAIFGGLAGFGIGNGVQANQVAHGLNAEFGIPTLWSGLVMAAITGLVLIGGIRWIAEVAGKLVPVMAIAYVGAGVLILLLHAAEVPAALALIVSEAFQPTAAVGGFAGATIMLAMQMGVARGIFSNEAGLGSAPIAHAAAASDNPVQQGTVAMLGTFIDTIIVCTITGLVIVLSGQWQAHDPAYDACVARGGVVEQRLATAWAIERPSVVCIATDTAGKTTETNRAQTGAGLSSAAFGAELPGRVGAWIVALGLVLFAFTTILGWAVYGERCVEYLFGVKAILPFRILWTIAVPFGAMVELDFAWLVADTLNALMAIPNLIALLALSPVVFRMTREYFAAAPAARD